MPRVERRVTFLADDFGVAFLTDFLAACVAGRALAGPRTVSTEGLPLSPPGARTQAGRAGFFAAGFFAGVFFALGGDAGYDGDGVRGRAAAERETTDSLDLPSAANASPPRARAPTAARGWGSRTAAGFFAALLVGRVRFAGTGDAGAVRLRLDPADFSDFFTIFTAP